MEDTNFPMHNTDKRFTKKVENFICDNCGQKVNGNGYTDHCYNCLYSKHVDIMPGDRKNTCRGIMIPEYTIYENMSYTIHYKCETCGFRKKIIAAADDNEKMLEELVKTNK